MVECKRSVLLVGRFAPGALEYSYEFAFRELGWEVQSFDMAGGINRYARFGPIGRFLNKFLPVEPWIRKANIDLVLATKRFAPDLMIVFGQNAIRVGTLAQIQSAQRVTSILVWPDPLPWLDSLILSCLPLYELVATFSKATVSSFRRLGAQRVEWIPLAADPHSFATAHGVGLHRNAYTADVSFVGAWGSDREEAMLKLGEFNLKIWGPDWGRHTRNRKIRKAWQGRAVYGPEFANVVRNSKININVIKPEGPAAANMRFFEIPCAGGLQLCSLCSEMETEFKHGETLFYYRDVRVLPEMIRELLANDELRRRVSETAQEKVLKEHTYVHRVERILELLT